MVSTNSLRHLLVRACISSAVEPSGLICGSVARRDRSVAPRSPVVARGAIGVRSRQSAFVHRLRPHPVVPGPSDRLLREQLPPVPSMTMELSPRMHAWLAEMDSLPPGFTRSDVVREAFQHVDDLLELFGVCGCQDRSHVASPAARIVLAPLRVRTSCSCQ